MGKKRVYQAAKELGIPSKELIVRLAEAGLGKKSNFSALEDSEIKLINDLFNNDNGVVVAETDTAEQQASATEVESKPEAVVPQESTETPASEAAEAAELEKLLAKEEASLAAAAKSEAVVAEKPKRSKSAVIRPPVVTILGHVDHGKTTLLDYIRKTQVVEGEAGGITQSIGAYQAEYNGQKITFIDTPGHAAFTNMRARGAQATDMVVLVVAADDGVMAQTEEAINHAKAAGVPILVAINKIDKAPDRLDRVKQDLVQHGLTPEDWGGDTITVPLSALSGEGVDDLLEMIVLTAELLELYADPEGAVEAVVIESHLDPQKGAITSILVRDGTLRARDVVVIDTSFGRIRALSDDRGRQLDAVGPGTPAQLLGLDIVPPAGAMLEAVEKLSQAKELVQQRKGQERQARLAPERRSMSDLMSQLMSKGKLSLVLKADSMGSLEVMEAELKKIDLKDVSIEILHAGVGPIGESDVMLAASGEDTQAAVIGFRTTADKNAASKARQNGVTVRTYNIIYDLTQEVERALKNLMEPEYKEVKLAEIEVRNVFKIPRVGMVAGCYVRDGVVVRNSQVRVFRDGVEVYEGPLRNLKRFDDDARQVEKGKECGILLENFDDIQEGDLLENFKLEQIEV